MSLVHKSPFFAPIGICSTDRALRQMYRSALERLGKVRESSELAPSQGTQILVIDLDSLPGDWDSNVGRARAVFGEGELIALSSRDTAQAALGCLKAGFADYLLKPVSPEQLGWAVHRSLQRIDVVGRLQMGKNRISRTVSRISTAATPDLVRHSLLEFIRQTFACESAAWLTPQGTQWEVALALPEPPLEHTLGLFPTDEVRTRVEPWIRADDTGGYGLFLPCHNEDQGGICLSGLEKRPPASRLEPLALLLEYAEATLLNLENYEEIKQQTFKDDLTNLFNARYLKYALPQYVSQSDESGGAFSVLFIDVDHFKAINDNHGHLVGSDFLIAIARTIKHAVRDVDPVFRYGGDEFVVILKGMGAEAGREVAERIRKHVDRRLFVIREKRLKTTVSIGVACYPTHADNVTALLQLADDAMYSVKRKSRNSVSLAIPEPPAPEATP